MKKGMFTLKNLLRKGIIIATCSGLFTTNVSFAKTKTSVSSYSTYYTLSDLSAMSKMRNDASSNNEIAQTYKTLRNSTPEKINSAMAEDGNVVYVRDLKDFPTPYQGVIKLLPNKMYILSGLVNIGNNAINLNGAGLKGLDPGKDGVISSVNGAVLRSRDVLVYMESVAVICASSETKAYDLADVTGTNFLNLFAGCSVLDAPNIQSQGVGQITGFNTICMIENYWKTRDGMKLTGSMEKFTSTLNYITGISSGGVGIELLSNANIKDVIIQSCYFVYSGQTGIKVNKGAMVDQGRLHINLFRGVTKHLDGFDSFTPGWEMQGNGEGVPDSKANGFIYMSENTAPTGFKGITLFGKIMGTTKVVKHDKFITESSNKFVFTGKRLTALNVTAIATAVSVDDKGSYSICIMKNGKEQIAPNSNVSAIAKGSGFQLFLQTQCELISGDYIEVFLKNNTSTNPIIVTDLQFKVSE